MFSILIEFIIRLMICQVKPIYPINLNNRYADELPENIHVKIELFVHYLKCSELENLITCPICLEDLQINDQVCTLICHKTHIFHFICLSQWIKYNSTCPSCKALIKCERIDKN